MLARLTKGNIGNERAKMQLRNKRIFQLGADLLILLLAFIVSWLVRFDFVLPQYAALAIISVLPFALSVKLSALYFFGIHRIEGMHFGFADIKKVFLAMTFASLVFLLARFWMGLFDFSSDSSFMLPYGVISIDSALACIALCVPRGIQRFLLEQGVKLKLNRIGRVPTVLIGADITGAVIAKEVLRQPKLKLNLVGFIDDDESKHGVLIHGLKVLGSIATLPRICKEKKIGCVLLSSSNIDGKLLQRVRRLGSYLHFEVKIIPGIDEIVEGKVEISRLRSPSIEDLLQREPVSLRLEQIAETLQQKTVMITGAGGSIGSELCRQVVRFGIKKTHPNRAFRESSLSSPQRTQSADATDPL